MKIQLENGSKSLFLHTSTVPMLYTVEIKCINTVIVGTVMRLLHRCEPDLTHCTKCSKTSDKYCISGVSCLVLNRTVKWHPDLKTTVT